MALPTSTVTICMLVAACWLLTTLAGTNLTSSFQARAASCLQATNSPFVSTVALVRATMHVHIACLHAQLLQTVCRPDAAMAEVCNKDWYLPCTQLTAAVAARPEACTS